ncbi:MAG: acyl-CoA carboxylase subunit epsilon [Tetrasphaera sp.]|nr:acyl-CoA carboxylase subunit epsilon [Tetrasphaera sp.]
MSTPETPAAPVIQILHGHPTPEEIATVVAVLTAAGGGGGAEVGARHTSEWSSAARLVRVPYAAGPRAWTHSAWPA